MAPSDDVVEDKADNRPRNIVDRGRGRDEASAVEDDGEIDVFDERVGPLEVDQVRTHGRECAREEEEDKSAEQEVSTVSTGQHMRDILVDLSLRELPLWSNDTPNDGCSAKHLSRRALDTYSQEFQPLAHALPCKSRDEFI